MSAMDAICVCHEGQYTCTPFYVGFSSTLFSQAAEEKVHVIVNYKTIHEVGMTKDVNGIVCFDGKGSLEGRRVPSHKQLEAMGLKKGVNSVAFATQTSNQMVSAKIFLWDISEKIIVTDIDGTITRSDKRGHFYSRMGLNWHHNSVVTCFKTLFDLGYKILYLTARSVTMDGVTRRYLDDLGLPAGPLLLSHKGFMDAFASEVITKDAKLGKFEHLESILEYFPFACLILTLKDVVKLFPNSNDIPIVAGFGNNENDEWAYKEAGVPPDHIFIVNKKSEIIVANAKTSYEIVCKEVCKFFKSLVEELKKSSEMLPANSETSEKALDKNTENPLKHIDEHDGNDEHEPEHEHEQGHEQGHEHEQQVENGHEDGKEEHNGAPHNDNFIEHAMQKLHMGERHSRSMEKAGPHHPHVEQLIDITSLLM